ncbi:MAG: 4-alpha-glucanotransferase [Bacteroidales bacterium]|nr:4-alpha-glucanotransferase [Bacteroidales bacterium]
MNTALPYQAGVAVPVFSLRSEDSCGIGEFLDLKKLADWCVLTGLKLIQILPINDTTTDGGWGDSYPYKSISTKALHPIYLNLEKVGLLKDANDRKRFEKLKKELNAKEFVDYPAVFETKMWYLKKVYGQKRGKKREFYEFLQEHCDKQLSEAVAYLHERGIMLKGDLPIGVSRDSDDVKKQPHLFNLDMETGAPPDGFAPQGQNWGFPTYNWTEMEADGFKWWKDRVEWFKKYFDALRIDHILGFFRIWEIPKGSPDASYGHYSPEDPRTWEIEGRKRLSQIFDLPGATVEMHGRASLQQQPSRLLICGEDLGMVAPCVPGVMRELGILSLEVQRMPKQGGRPFSDPRENPYLSVDTTGTHDMPTIRGWWEQDRDLSARFYRELLHHTDGAPYFCEPYVCQEIIEQHFRSSSRWVIIPIQDYIAMDGDFRWDRTWDEQINDPSNPNHKWKYRMHQSLEALIGNKKLIKIMKDLKKCSSR